MAFHVTGGGNRLQVAALMAAGIRGRLTTSGRSECCQNDRPHKAPRHRASPHWQPDWTRLQTINNEFQGGGIYHVPPSTRSAASTLSVEGVRIAGNSMKSGAKGTKATNRLRKRMPPHGPSTFATNWCSLVLRWCGARRRCVGLPRAAARPRGCRSL